MVEYQSVRTFVEKFKRGIYVDPRREVQIEAGWYDWFCRETSLAGKTKFLGAKVVQLSLSPMIDRDNMYVMFKNNCPGHGTLYDSFSFCDMKTNDVKYWITPANGHFGSHYRKPEVYGYNGGQNPKDNYFDNWREVRQFFGV